MNCPKCGAEMKYFAEEEGGYCKGAWMCDKCPDVDVYEF